MYNKLVTYLILPYNEQILTIIKMSIKSYMINFKCFTKIILWMFKSALNNFKIQINSFTLSRNLMKLFQK